MIAHIPVLKKEVLEYLDIKPNENIIDGTIGEAGHSIEILEKNGPKGKILGIDQDAHQIENSKLRLTEFKERGILVNDSYANIKDIIEKTGFGRADGILVDLGYSSWHLEESERGFSFNKNEPLDMRYNEQGETTAEKIINEYAEIEIARILTEYGEEKYSKKIARAIVSQRKIKKITTTFELKSIIEKAIQRHFDKIHPATRSFQAIRIAVNGELDSLQKFLPQAIEVLKVGGKLLVISFHSLEDRIVKNFFNDAEKKGLVKIITKKPVTVSEEEIIKNPRSRSAKLRVIVKS